MVNEIYLLYAATDHDIAAAVREAIEKVGFVVRDSRGASSDSFRGLAREAVDASGALMVLWSEAMSDPNWVDADVKLIVAAWSRDRLLMARIDGAALPIGLRDQPCHELRSDQLDRNMGNLTLATLALHRAELAPSSTGTPSTPASSPAPVTHFIQRRLPEGKSVKVCRSRAITIIAFSIVLLLALSGLAWRLFFTEADNLQNKLTTLEANIKIVAQQVRVATIRSQYSLDSALMGLSADSQAQQDLSTAEEALRQLEAEVNRLKEERRRIEEQLKNSGEAAADPPPVTAPSTLPTSEPEKPWLLWTGGGTVAIIICIGAYCIVRGRRHRSARPAPPENRAKRYALIGDSHEAVGEPFPAPQFPIFVSYSRKDEPVVQSIVQELKGSGYAVWIDFASQQGVQRFAGSIVAAIRECRVFALVGSRNSFASDHVIREIYVAGDFKKPFLVFEIDQLDFPDDVLYFISGFPRVPMTDITSGKVQAAVSRLLAAA